MADPSRAGRTRANGWRTTLIGLLLVAVAVGVCSNLITHRRVESKNACIRNLRQLDRAIEQWAMDHRKRTNDLVNVPEMLSHLPGSALPVCPRGGQYTIGRVGETPVCSYPGHSL